MVALSDVQSSNEAISKTLPPDIVAVFVGATSGIGKAALLHFAQHARQPRIYFIGRSQQAADDIQKQLRSINPDGRYEFIKADVSLLSVVDEVCSSIREKESRIDILFQSQGTLDISTGYFFKRTQCGSEQSTNKSIETTEKLSLIMALGYYSRMRFIANFLPMLQQSSLSRVVIVLAGTKEGPVNSSDLPGRRVLPWKARGHLCSMITLTLEHFARLAPEVSFIHNYPGFVETPLSQSMKGLTGVLMKSVFRVTSLFTTREYVSLDETGERHVFLATGARFPSKKQTDLALRDGSALSAGKEVAVGSDGVVGSGVYIIDEICESGDSDVQKVLKTLRVDGTDEKIWEHMEKEFVRITGKTAMPGSSE
jgi:NAD(P)-dependent dehydrogenase (short-subunit alcohol dehydrogenase family)